MSGGILEGTVQGERGYRPGRQQMDILNRLKDPEVKNAKPREKDYRLSDGGGLYLVVKSSGGRLWRWSYEFKGKEKLLSYGPYPFVSLAPSCHSPKRDSCMRPLAR
jgi:hypothetical protein